MNYTDYVATIANLMATDATNTNFLQIFPSAQFYAEDRIYRELDPLAAQVVDTGAVSANVRNFTLPSNLGKFVVIRGINIFTPVSTTTTRNPVTPASLDYINVAWPSETSPSVTTVPTNFAVLQQESDGDTVITFGPSPGAAFNVEVIGMIQPAALSDANPTNYLSIKLPDLLVAATMIYMSAYQKNFGAQSDDPRQAQSWEDQYTKLFASAAMVEGRKKFSAVSWTSESPQPVSDQRG